MDPERGLPSLPDKSVDLCLTDPPWNINYKGVVGSTGEKTKSVTHYKDKINNYDKWCEKWFLELKRICNIIILSISTKNIKMWYDIEEPKDIFIHYRKNGGYGSVVAYFNCFTPYLFYMYKKKLLPKKSILPFLTHNVIEKYSTSGAWHKLKLLHTSPKNYDVWFKIVKRINPISVIDPFLGSGTTAEVCTKLGIPWLGYEINEVYRQDIEKRLKNCKREPQQTSLEAFQK